MLTGAVGIGLGFGLQSIASNFVSGFVLLLDKSIKPGDVISFTGTTGTSTRSWAGSRSCADVTSWSAIATASRRVLNQNLITKSVINWSYLDDRVRLRLPVT